MSDTRDEILKAAFAEFIEKGYDGARLKAIADRPGVTKAMIHYYFDNKKRLFEETYRIAVTGLTDDVFQILEKEESLFKKIEQFIEAVLDRAEQNREKVAFMVEELHRNPDITQPVLQEHLSLSLGGFDKQLEKAASDYEIIQTDSKQLLMNIFSLCLFPYTASGLFNAIFELDSDRQYRAIIKKRKGLVVDIILNSLTS